MNHVLLLFLQSWGADFSEDYPKLNAWYQNASEKLKGFAENQDGAKTLAESLSKILDEPLWK